VSRPKVRVFERKRVHFPPGVPAPKYRDPLEGTFVEISYETDMKPGERESQAARRALDELSAELSSGGSMQPDSLEDRLRKLKS
jgi:hypothetical protein